MTEDLNLSHPPKIIWHVGNLHVYERHFDKVK